MKLNLPNFLKSGIASSLLIGATAASSLAGSFTYDLRATSVSGVGQVENIKTVSGVAINDVVSFDIYAVIKGDNLSSADEAIQFAYFGIYTANANNAVGGTLGSSFTQGTTTALTGVTGQGVFAAGPNQGGNLNTDVNADGSPDIGPALSNTTAASYAKIRATAMSYAGQPISVGFGITAGVGQEFKIGSIQFKVSALNNLSNSTSINVGAPASLGLTIKTNWQFDSATGALSTQGVVNSTGVSITALAVPEPTSFAMLMMGSLGLVGFRRPSFRRSA